MLHLHRRYRELEEGKGGHSQLLAKILGKRLEPTTQRLIVADFRSGEPARQKGAAQLLGSLGKVAVPLLIDIIKKEEDFRIRQIAASLLAELGTEGAELLYILDNKDSAVREAAFQLIERLSDDQVIKLLLNYVNSRDTQLAVAAMECLGRLKSASAVELLTSVLRSSREVERLLAACQALGRIADPSSIDPLAKILESRGVFFFRRRPHAKVRAAAAHALSNIHHPAVIKVFARLVYDDDPRVREVARSIVSDKMPSSPERS